MATAGDDWMRPALVQGSAGLGRVLAELAADAAEVHGLGADGTAGLARRRAAPTRRPAGAA